MNGSIEQTPRRKGQKRKKSKTNMFERIMSKVMKVMTDGLRESDRMFVELEKRMEMEVQQKREECQFQLQLAQMFLGQPSASTEFQSPSYYPKYPNQFYGSRPALYCSSSRDDDKLAQQNNS